MNQQNYQMTPEPVVTKPNWKKNWVWVLVVLIIIIAALAYIGAGKGINFSDQEKLNLLKSLPIDEKSPYNGYSDQQKADLLQGLSNKSSVYKDLSEAEKLKLLENN